MGIRESLDISAYLVAGPENCKDRPFGKVVRQAVDAGFTCVQVRAKDCSARQIMDCVREAEQAIASAGKQDRVALLVNDRLDVALACRDAGMKVDGIHVGQTDIPVEVCRRYLGPDAIVGLSAGVRQMIDYVRAFDASCVDYFGVGPLHETETKKDLRKREDGSVITRTIDELEELARITPVPVVVGGGVKLPDISVIKATGLHGFFVVSAVCGAQDPYSAARELVDAWGEA